MSAHLERAHVLVSQSRFREAKEELLRYLQTLPEDGFAHALLALCDLNLELLQDATAHAERAIALAPELPIAHFMHAHAVLARNRLPEAEAAALETIRLEPEDADNFALLAAVKMQRHAYGAALAAADAGLALLPTHTGCLNRRATALVMLGRKAEAADTMTGALASSPEDAATHANQGFALLHGGQPREAIAHFREALRLDPESGFARAGIVEALKARNIVYRMLLRYFFWVARLPRSSQGILLASIFFGPQLLRTLGGKDPGMQFAVEVLIGLLMAFVALTWLGDAAFNLLLRFDKDGRYALDDDQIRGANLLAGYLAMPLLMVLALAATGIALFQGAALRWALVCLPAAAVFRCERGWPRSLAIAMLSGLTALTIVATWPPVLATLLAAGVAPRGLLSVPVIHVAGWCSRVFFPLFITAELGMLYLLQQRVRR